MRHGLYVTVAKDGTIGLLQFDRNRLVEAMQGGRAAPPKRRTLRRIGTSFTGLLDEQHARRQRELADAFLRLRERS